MKIGESKINARGGRGGRPRRRRLVAAASIIATTVALTLGAAPAFASVSTGKLICSPSTRVVLNMNLVGNGGNDWTYVFYSGSEYTYWNTLQHELMPGIYHLNTGYNPAWAAYNTYANALWSKGCSSAI